MRCRSKFKPTRLGFRPRRPADGAASHERGTTDSSNGAPLDLRLACGVQAPALARRALEAWAVAPADVLHDLQLLATELVTNGMLHGDRADDGWIGLRARADATGWRLEVCDRGPGFHPPPPSPEPPLPDEVGGRGLWLVDALSDRWGARRTLDERWEVWLEIDASDAGR